MIFVWRRFRFQPPPAGTSEIQLHREPPAAYLEADLEVNKNKISFVVDSCSLLSPFLSFTSLSFPLFPILSLTFQLESQIPHDVMYLLKSVR